MFNKQKYQRDYQRKLRNNPEKKERVMYYQLKSQTKRFINCFAKDKDILEIQELIEGRK
ncbi:hypothetical protein [Latilactobacillus graminis]|uniref:hypothetical protein n=1 Tax=Latilactobacillus graminis TaxID=60519 RepID=UPI000A87A948|nr:hypothetical protein [Latilactobacillus graminis]